MNIKCSRTHPLLKVNHEELEEEVHEVAGIVAVPDGEEEERGALADVLVAHELEPLEHIPATERKG